MLRHCLFALVLLAGLPGLAGAAPYGLEPGKYHALIIANQNYQVLPSLKTPHADAEALAELLRRDYGFRVTTLKDADRASILDALDLQVERLGEQDNLLIFYAGHGHLDQATGEGYWLPISANPRRRSEWVSNNTITDTLRALRARHVMVISDSCFSGTLTRNVRAGLSVAEDRGAYYHKLLRQRSRTAMTSGGLEPVDDGGAAGHSVFAGALLASLGQNREPVLEGEQLYQLLRRPVSLNSTAQQQPAYADVRQTGHDGGDFLFIQRNPVQRAASPGQPPAATTASVDPGAYELSFWDTIKDSRDPRDFAAYLKAYPEGRFAALARLRAREPAPATVTQPPTPAPPASPAQPPAVGLTASPRQVGPPPSPQAGATAPPSVASSDRVVLLAYAVPEREYAPEFESVEAFSAAVAGLMRDSLGLDNAVLVTDKTTTRAQINEGSDAATSRGLCVSHAARVIIGAELIMTRDIPEELRSPDKVYFSVYDCASHNKRFKGYPLNLNVSDGFTYQSSLQSTLSRFNEAFSPLARQ